MSGIAGPTNPAWHEGQFGTQPGSSRNEGHQGELREEQEKIKQLHKFNYRCFSYLIRRILLGVSDSIHAGLEKYCANSYHVRYARFKTALYTWPHSEWVEIFCLELQCCSLGRQRMCGEVPAQQV